MNRLTTLALSLYSNKGAYALLLGSGISRSAHIPSAWEVENILISKIGAVEGVTGIDDWHEWYKSKFGKETDYSTLLDELAKTKTERVGLMREFFMATKEDKEMGWKLPTEAHRAIARLAKWGYVKVIMTTNFDRLIEEALSSEGVTFQEVLHESDLDKITPLTHCQTVTVVKINGDYIDCRFRNTSSELESYPVELKCFLSRIIEDYGLITCGWSATWDTGLVSIIKEATKSRYNSFFSYVGNAVDALEKLAAERHGETMKIEGADYFFKELSEQVEALERNTINKKLGRDIILSRVKKYLSSDQYAIELTELIERMGDEVYQSIMSIADYRNPLTQDSFSFFLERHHDAVSTLVDVAIVVGRWGKTEHIKLIGEIVQKLCIRRWVNGMVTCQGSNYVHGIGATLLFNALGISCVNYGKFQGLNEVMAKDAPAENYVTMLYRKPLLYLVGDCHLGRKDLNALIGCSYYYPYSILLKNILHPHFNATFMLEADYDCAFYKWERLKSMMYGYNKCYIMDTFWVPTGHFWHYEIDQRVRQKAETPYCTFFDSAHQLKDNWPPLKQGMFGGSYDEYKKVYDAAEEIYKNNNVFW